MDKTCTRCETPKPLDQYDRNRTTKDGLCHYCKPCRKAYRAQSYHEHDENVKAKAREYYYANADACRARSRQRRKAHPDKAMKRHHERYHSDPAYRVQFLYRGAIRKMLRRDGARKDAKSLTLCGCSYRRLVDHIESLWKPGMTWENNGVYRYGGPMTWHIDHKRPCASFDLIDPAQQRECFHWSNLQPLWADENMSKGASIA